MQVCCVYSLESPHQGDSYVETLHTIILLDREDILKLFIFASVPGAMINIHWLELPMSRTNFYGPKDIPAIEVWLYLPKYSDILTGNHTAKYWKGPFADLMIDPKVITETRLIKFIKISPDKTRNF